MSSCGICFGALQQAEGGQVAQGGIGTATGGVIPMACVSQGTAGGWNIEANPGPGSTTTIGSGSFSGTSGMDWSGFITDIGSTISHAVGQVSGPQYTRLPNGQILLPTGQVVGNAPLFQQGSGSMFLIIGVAVILLIVLMSGKK